MQTLLVLYLLLVDDAEPEVDFVGLVKVWIHADDGAKGLFRVFVAAVSVVQNANAVPKLWLL